MAKRKSNHKNKKTTANKTSRSSGRQTKKRIVNRSYVAALMLSIFLGWLGIDRFYVNHIGLGILKLITFGGLGIWWLVDIIMFATKNVSYVEFD